MASGAYDLVLRENGARAFSPELSMFRRDLQFPLQFLLQFGRRAAAEAKARSDHPPQPRGHHRYREHVDASIARLLEHSAPEAATELIELGCHHEQQHQELLLTDILHLFAQNPLHPAYRSAEPLAVEPDGADALQYLSLPGGLIEVGHDGEGFSFDCEGPRHKTFIEPFRLADRLVTNKEWIEFIADGGYRNPLLWLSEGWAKAQAEGWTMPLYWDDRGDAHYWTMTLRGAQPVDPAAPVTHISYFEADAFATWAGRLFRPSSNGNRRRGCAATAICRF